LTTNLK